MKVFDLKLFRNDKKITQVYLAELFSCNQNFISRIENGVRPIPTDKLDILKSKYGDISKYYKEVPQGISIPDATPQDLIFSGAEAFTTQLIKMMNDKLIAPYGLVAEKDKEIERLNREIGKLRAQLEASKKMDAQEGNATCAVAE